MRKNAYSRCACTTYSIHAKSKIDTCIRAYLPPYLPKYLPAWLAACLPQHAISPTARGACEVPSLSDASSPSHAVGLRQHKARL